MDERPLEHYKDDFTSTVLKCLPVDHKLVDDSLIADFVHLHLVAPCIASPDVALRVCGAMMEPDTIDEVMQRARDDGVHLELRAAVLEIAHVPYDRGNYRAAAAVLASNSLVSFFGRFTEAADESAIVNIMEQALHSATGEQIRDFVGMLSAIDATSPR